MSALTRLLRPMTAAWLRERGDEYYRAGTVTLKHVRPHGVEATVQGQQLYGVFIDLGPRGVEVFCDCPYFSRSRQPCKHIWAVARAREESPIEAPRARAAALRGPWGQPAADKDVDEDLDDIQPWSPPLQRRRRPPRWQDHLLQVERTLAAAPRPAPPVPAELLYVVDVDESRMQGRLALDVRSHGRRRDGTPTRPKRFRLGGRDPASLRDDDRGIWTMLTGASRLDPWTYHGHTLPIPADLASMVLPLIAATGRGVVAAGDIEPTPFTWSERAWHLRLAVRAVDDEREVTASLTRGEDVRPLAEPLLLLADGLVVFAHEIAPFEHHGLFAWVSALRENGPLRFPAAAGVRLLASLARARQPPPVDLPDDLRMETAGPPRPRLALRASEWGPRNRYDAEVTFDYAGVPIPHHEPGWGIHAGTTLLSRDLPAERAALARATGLGLQAFDERLHVAAGRVQEMVRTLAAEGWAVEVDGHHHRGIGTLRMQVTSGIDWFDLEGALELDGARVPLPTLLRAVQEGTSEVVLADGTQGTIPEDALPRLRALLGSGKVAGEALRFARAQAPVLDALLAVQPDVDVDAAFARVREALQRFAGVEALPAPAGFHGTLRPYQSEGLGWTAFLREFGFGGILADDMGLGKTIQVLALLESRRAKATRPSLVVMPRSLVFNWKEEAARFTPGLVLVDHTHPTRGKDAPRFAPGEVVLATYGTLRRDAPALSAVEFDYVVLDEAQAIKNERTASAKAARLLKGAHRLALSGTPVENHLGELGSLLGFLNPGLLAHSPLLDRATERDAASLAVLARLLRPFVLRRTKEAVASDLPPRTEQVLHCPLDPEQRRLYDELREHYRQALLPKVERLGMGGAAMHVLEALLRLRQAACHPGLVDPRFADAPSGKLDALLPRLREIRAEGHKAVVFSQFTKFLGLLRTHLDAEQVPYAYLDGRTRDRAARVKSFQDDPACPLFLVSLKAGGVGLNLTAAEYVFLLDPWWNPAVEAQAIDRAHRIGQRRPVFAYRLLAEGTVEEKVHALQETKRDLARAIVGDDAGGLASLKREDLEMLLS